MAPYFDHVERLVNVQKPADRLVNENNRLLVEGAKQLGWKVEKIPGARQPDMCTNSGHCLQGCSYDAKQSQLVTNIPRALSRGATLYADCRAERVLVENGKATGVAASVMDRATGKPKATLTVQAKVVVLAAGGVGSPVFLLRAGQANSSGMVGKNLFLNPSPMTFSRFDHPVRMWESVPATLHVDRFRRGRYDASGTLVEGGYLLMANNLQPGAAAAVLPGFGAEHRAWMEAYEHLAGTYAILDDEHPGELVLDEVNKPVFKYTVRGNDLLKCRDFLKKSAQVMLAAGAQEVLIPDSRATVIRSEAELEKKIAEVDLRPGSILYAAPHPIGTCRMGEDPRTSVVNSRCESHDIGNLFLADASIFPTSISVDPSISIMAFAAKTATHVIERVRA
jgi:choline dehydrogenase-like flavoprotein